LARVSRRSGLFTAIVPIVAHLFIGFERQVSSYLHVDVEIADVGSLILLQDTNLINAPY
jgi:hypothetical protein